VFATFAGRRPTTVIAGNRYTGAPFTSSPVNVAMARVSPEAAAIIAAALSHADAGAANARSTVVARRALHADARGRRESTREKWCVPVVRSVSEIVIICLASSW